MEKENRKAIFKRITAVLMAVVMLLCAAPLGGLADFDFSAFTLNASALRSGDYSYYVSEGKAVIDDFNTDVSGKVTIPSVIDGYPVVEIAQCAFMTCKNITEVIIPEGVTSIGYSAFEDCKSLEYVKIPESVTSIGRWAFANCYELYTITIPDKVTSIGSYTFYDCGSLSSVYIGKSVESIGEYAFCMCESLTYVKIPDSVTIIYEDAFDCCEGLEKVKIGKGVAEIWASAFRNCYNLKTVIMPKSVTEIHSFAFDECSSLTDVYYTGSESQWNDIIIGDVNTCLTDATIHYLLTETVTLAPTCTREGIMTYTCSCGHSFTEPIPPLGHNSKNYPAVDPTCTEEGYTSGVYCSTCETWLSGHQLRNAYGHTWKNATCTAPKTCSACRETEGEALGHNWAEATCTSAKTCSRCKTTEGSANGHKWVEATCTNKKYCSVCSTETGDYAHIWKAATCTTAKTCTLCGTTEGDILGHKWVGATCNMPKHCSRCGQEEGKKLEHIWEYHSKKEPSCENPGYEMYQCSLCKGTKENTIDATGHQNIEIIPAVEPTCKIQGNTEGKRCADCGHYFITPEAIDCIPHTEVIVPGRPATCTEFGYTDGVECSACGVTLVLQQMIMSSGHKRVEIPTVPATCTEPMITGGIKCSVCEEILVEPYSYGNPKGHNYEWVVEKEATCLEDGYEVSKCSVCGDIGEEHITTKFDHFIVHAEAPKTATCTEDGTDGGEKCNKCNTVLKEPKITPAYGHQFVSMPEKMATCTEAGIEIVRCAYCGLISEEKVIPAKGHTEVIEGKNEPTCTSEGNTGDTVCSACGIILKEGEIIPAKGHTIRKLTGKEPTCTEEGITDGTECAVCGVELIMQERIPPKGHTEVIIPAVKATYKKSGKTEGKECSVCGEILVKQKKVARKKLGKVKSLKLKSKTSSSVTLSWKKVTGAESYKVYYSTNGKKWKSVKVTKNSATVKNLSAAKNYQFKVRAFAGKYYGSVSSIVKITTKFTTAALSKVTSSKKGTAVAKWKKTKNASGYVIEYSTSKKFTKKTTKTVTVKKGKTTKTTIKNLKSGKKYYVRVKAYKTVNKKAVYGEFSKVKTVKVK